MRKAHKQPAGWPKKVNGKPFVTHHPSGGKRISVKRKGAKTGRLKRVAGK